MREYVVDSPLINEWDWEKNNELGLDPEKITLGSGKRAWWICNKGHEWPIIVANRANGSGCPYCSGYYILAGYNDLVTTRPDLASEWDYDKNKDLLPTQISRGYGHKVWWKCNICGYEWSATPNSRDNMGSGCPECARGKKTSDKELMIFFLYK